MPRSIISRYSRTTAIGRPHRAQKAKCGSTAVSHHGHAVRGTAALSSSNGSSALMPSSPASGLFLRLGLVVGLPQAKCAERLRVLEAVGRTPFLRSGPDPLVDRPVVDLALVAAKRSDLRLDGVG